MSEKTVPATYANGLIFELQKAFYDERGRGARFRLTTLGRSLFAEKVRSHIKAADIEGILKEVAAILEQEGITAKVDFQVEEKLLRIQVQGCLHRAVEDQIVARGIEPFTCIPANQIVLAIKEKLDRTVELAEIKLEDGSCSILLIVFEKRPDIS